MKKFKNILLSVVLLFTSSCKNKKEEAKFLLSGNFDAKTYVELTNDDLAYKLEQEESFVLYIHVEGCSSCASFENTVLKSFIKETHSVIYGIDSGILDNNKIKYSTCPTISIIKDGKQIKTTNYKKSNEIFTESSEFKKHIEKYAILPRMFTISEESLDTKIKGHESFVLYVGWNKCGDCKSLEERVLNNYLKNNTLDYPLYYLESDPYRNGRKASLEECTSQEEINKYNAWIEFAKKYKFYEYREGKIPSLVCYRDGIFMELLVYLNDVVDNNKIVSSYHSEIINRNMSEEELLNYHDKKVISFLNMYCYKIK